MWGSGDNYVCDYDTHTALLGPLSCREASDFIVSQGDIKAQSRLCNMSRYALAKEGRYPRTKVGDAELARDVELYGREGTEVHVRMQNDGRDFDSACDADYHQHCACPATCKCDCHAHRALAVDRRA